MNDGTDLPQTLKRKIDLARAAVGAERFWPLLTLLGVLAAAFLALAWAGLFSQTPLWVRIVGVGLFGLGASVILAMMARWRLPDDREGARRLDLSVAALHRPVSALRDRAAGEDPVAAALWRRHQERAEQAAATLKVPRPVSLVPGRDRFALRALVVLVAAAAAFVAGDERLGRLADAFTWSAPKPPATPPRLDAWIDPPAYTGRAPIFLSGANPQEGPVSVPVGSIAVVRVSPGDGVALNASPALKPREAEPATTAAGTQPAAPKPATFEQRLTVTGDGTLEVRGPGGAMGRYALKSIPDLPPTVDFTEIETEDRGQTLKLRYRLADDYGIVRTEAVIARADKAGARTLVPPPEVTVGGRIGENEAALATQEHPWAGVRVSIKLRATDDLGQTGESEARETVLPSRRFENALAKALIEQRRNIVTAPDDRRRVHIALDGLLAAPDRFVTKSGDFLMLSIAQRKLRDARGDADLIAFAQYLWETAVALDEGLLSDAERALRAAEDRLREALERGATPDEVRRLMDELRQAMNEFLREFAERNRDNNAERNDRDQNRTLSQRDLNDMLRQIEEMHKRGDTAQAQELLRQLQEMMRNLRQAQRQQGDPRQREMGEALDELEKMLREQENLRDETFRDNQRRRERAQRQQRGQQQGQQGQRGQRQQGQQQQGQQGGQDGEEGEEGEEGAEGQQGGGQSLAERQQQLRDRLNRLRERLRQQGAGDEEGFDGAEEGMGDAEQNLRRRQGGRATQGQQQAIDELGRAGRGLSQQMQQEMGDGTEQGEGQDGFGPGNPNPNNPRGRADQRNTDPLGRPLYNRGNDDQNNVRIPQSGDVMGAGDRARRVLEELRKRLGETERSRDELDYIERLMPRN